MARFTLSLGRCSFCDAAAARNLPLAGNAERPSRICQRCVTRFLDASRRVPLLEDIEPTAMWQSDEERAPSAEPVEQVSVGDVLRAFRKRVEEVVGTSDRDARFHLGIAYHEMGLLDEAIAEFEIASAEPALKAQSIGLIGICLRARGDSERAVQRFSEAIKIPGTSDGQKAAFFFELAVALEELGERGKARKMMQQVWALDPAFPRTPPARDHDLEFRQVREAFAGGGSRDAFRLSREDYSETGLLSDVVALEATLRLAPESVRARITLASLCVKLGRMADAAHHYLLAAVDYRRTGSPLRAAAAYEMVVGIGVNGLAGQAHAALAELCEEMRTQEAESHRRAALQTGTSSSVDVAPLLCSFCNSAVDFLRPPVRGDTTTICSDCILEASAHFDHSPTF